VKVAEDVMAVLARAHCDGGKLVLVGQLDRKMYEAVNQVLVAAGGKWNRGAKAHLFEGVAAERIEQVLLTGEVTTVQDLNYFPTPEWIGRQMLDYGDVYCGMTVLEPSAGRGALVNVISQRAVVDAIEQHEPFVKELVDTGHCRSVAAGDFLAIRPEGPLYDRVVMNPPFGKQADIRHVLHALQFVKPGGRLVSVMANGVGFRSNRDTVAFRLRVEDAGGYFDLLPDDAFKESGTGVRTVLCVIPVH
jgi:hypothetical protein